MIETPELRLSELEAAIIAAIAAHPDWLFPILRAATAGVSAALERSERRRATCEAAFLAAISLATTGRIDAETRRVLNHVVARAIDPENASSAERRVLERSADAAG